MTYEEFKGLPIFILLTIEQILLSKRALGMDFTDQELQFVEHLLALEKELSEGIDLALKNVKLNLQKSELEKIFQKDTPFTHND